jgi:DNA repair protein RecN (Recombination protein N)
VLTELVVEDLGVIARLSLLLGPGMTAVTGETGAGKTLVVTAIELLVGGRADAGVVRPGAEGARVEGRFVEPDGSEVVLARVIPATGRSRAYVDGRLAPVARLAEVGAALVDLHGQHDHQSLLAASTQREALDSFGDIALAPLRAARARVAEIDAALAALGGDERARAREIDLLRFQVEELDAAALRDPDEDAALAAEEDRLGDAVAHREAAAAAHEALSADDGAIDALGRAVAAVAGRGPLANVEERLRSAAAELSEAAADVRALGESIEDDPARLAALRERRHLLHELRRKYGETLADVLRFADEARRRLEELEGHDARAATLDADRTVALEAVTREAAAVAAARREAAPRLAAAVTTELAALAMARARIEVVVGDGDPGDDIRFLLAANAGEGLGPLSKVASGGELARTMLALRLVLSRHVGELPVAGGTLVFDEVDAGIGGEAALAVGRSLADLGRDAQVLVVTHLPQVAAFADAQVAVTKGDLEERTVATARVLDDADRVVELSRMLSGQPDSTVARDHAEELLAVAARERGR